MDFDTWVGSDDGLDVLASFSDDHTDTIRVDFNARGVLSLGGTVGVRLGCCRHYVESCWLLKVCKLFGF
ncbi:MAG TPA: hypothetical protein HPP54_09990 [Nitrospinae bacterium]|nr:hypothetical protein [Nitrospinota bacterium]